MADTYTENQIRSNLKRCAAWLGRFVAEVGYEGCPGPNAVVAHACRQAMRNAVAVGEASFLGVSEHRATRLELLAALERCIPWMWALVDGGHHKGCGMPRDAVESLDQAVYMVFPDPPPSCPPGDLGVWVTEKTEKGSDSSAS